MSDKRFWVRRPFDYAGEELDRGQIIELKGARNDEKLIRLGYVQERDRNGSFKECGVCFKRFVGEAERNSHAEMRHSDRYHGMTAEEKEAAMEDEVDRVEKRLDRDAPLYFDKTEASRTAGEGSTVIRTAKEIIGGSKRKEIDRAAQKRAKAQTGRVRSKSKPAAGRVARSAGR